MIRKSPKPRDSDTFTGGEHRQFQTTLWTNVLHSAGKDADRRREAWEKLAEGYWKPVYAWIRARWGGSSNEDAKDLTQDFFVWMMETSLPARADAGRGRFRTFLLASLKNYLLQGARSRRRLKRGGDRTVLSLENAPVASPDPADEALDRTWREELLARASRKMEEEYREQKKEVYFRVFRDYYFDDDEKLNHEQLAAKHSIAVSDVNNYLMNAKRRFRDILRDFVAETVDGPDELAKELNVLFGKGKP